jgi:hypothetical protein
VRSARQAVTGALCIAALAACASDPRSSQVGAVEAEARQFMAGYEAEMQAADGAALAARYHGAGAYWMLQGRKSFREHDYITRYFREVWSAPAEFRWTDLSYEVLGSDAVVVIGAMRFAGPDDRSVLGSYTALLVRQNGELKIRVEDEAFDDVPAAACPASDVTCGIPLDAGLAARYLGDYDQGAFQWTLFEHAGGYALRLPWDSAVAIVHYGNHEFRLADDPGVRILFDGSGERATSYTVFRGQMLGSGRRAGTAH